MFFLVRSRCVDDAVADLLRGGVSIASRVGLLTELDGLGRLRRGLAGTAGARAYIQLLCC